MLRWFFAMRNRQSRKNSRKYPKRKAATFYLPNLEYLEERRLLAVYKVKNTDAFGPDSLKQAILDANANAVNHQNDEIVFALPGNAPYKINLTGGLTVTDPGLVIAASTQDGYDEDDPPVVVVTGPGSNGAFTSGLYLEGGNETVVGLEIRDFREDGIQITTKGGDKILSCLLDMNDRNGVFIYRSSNNYVGGPNASDTNVISGNGAYGVTIQEGTQNVVSNNYIGTNWDGDQSNENKGGGIWITQASNNTIGGTTAGLGNLISGNTNGEAGVSISGNIATQNKIQGNIIGTTKDTKKKLPNEYGIALSAPSNEVSGNTISGNKEDGIRLTTGAIANRIFGNYIGTNAQSSLDVGNRYGITVYETSGNVIGGDDSSKTNVISGNAVWGVYMVNVE